VHFQEEFSKTARLSSRLDLFSNYKRNPHEVDILFNNIFGINIGKMFAATFIFDVLYDADFRKKTQIQEITGLGLRIRL
jgi:hypothetical protein